MEIRFRKKFLLEQLIKIVWLRRSVADLRASISRISLWRIVQHKSECLSKFVHLLIFVSPEFVSRNGNIFLKN